MPHKRSGVHVESSRTPLKFQTSSAGLDAEQLLNEIDNLALLLHEVRKQTDKIEAAADAIGDAILSQLGKDGKLSSGAARANRRSVLSIQPKSSSRPTLPTAATAE